MRLRRIISSRRTVAVAIAAALTAGAAVVMPLVFSAAPAAATSQAADKMVVQGTDGVALCDSQVSASAAYAGNCPTTPQALLTGTIKLSSPKNLVVEVTMDCSTLTDVSTTTTNNGVATSSEAASGVHAWLTLTPAGQTPDPTVGVIPVDPNTSTAGSPPANAGQINPGDVTFCNRDLFLKQQLTSASVITLATTLNIESQYANAFNWVSLPDANTTQTETVTLWGKVINSGCASGTTNCTNGQAASWVGQRTMILTPANTAQNAEFPS